MIPDRADIIAELQKQIFPLEGLRPVTTGFPQNMGLNAINVAFPNNQFPLGALHEFLCSSAEDKAATNGFVAGILTHLLRRGGVCIWISSVRTIFPPALKLYGIDPARVIFIEVQKQQEILWVVEEALKCGHVAAVVAEVRDVSFTASRRLQLAVEQSRVTGFIFRTPLHHINTTAFVARWKITSAPSDVNTDLPGPGFPRWNVELLKIRNGKPGSWQLEWASDCFRPISAVQSRPLLGERKIV